VIIPIPSGTRDVLPDEQRERRAITEQMRVVFEAHGYGEIATPALEYQSVLDRAELGGARPAYRVVDDAGELLVLRSDMTVPIARVVGTRYPTAEPPLRFSYLADCYRGVEPQRGQPREMLQAGIELVGGGTAEALTVLCRTLDATGLKGYRIGLGDAGLYPALLASLEVPAAAGETLRALLRARDLVGLEVEIGRLGLAAESAELLLRVPQIRGGPEVIHEPVGVVADALGGLRQVLAELEPAVTERVIFDLGLVPALGYYTGAVFEVYDPALGAPLGNGGRYDDLLGRFGRPLPAVGWAIGVDRLHIALAGEERG
jgi:ATP phosphoribosyltransferase regulatory subunit